MFAASVGPLDPARLRPLVGRGPRDRRLAGRGGPVPLRELPRGRDRLDPGAAGRGPRHRLRGRAGRARPCLCRASASPRSSATSTRATPARSASPSAWARCATTPRAGIGPRRPGVPPPRPGGGAGGLRMIPVLQTERLTLRAPRLEDFETDGRVPRLGPRRASSAGPTTGGAPGACLPRRLATGSCAAMACGRSRRPRRAPFSARSASTTPRAGLRPRSAGGSPRPRTRAAGFAFEAAAARCATPISSPAGDEAFSVIDPANARSIRLAERLGARSGPRGCHPLRRYGPRLPPPQPGGAAMTDEPPAAPPTCCAAIASRSTGSTRSWSSRWPSGSSTPRRSAGSRPRTTCPPPTRRARPSRSRGWSGWPPRRRSTPSSPGNS